MHKFETTSIVYLRCSIAICYGRVEDCQEVNEFLFLFEIKFLFSVYVQKHDDHQQ
jgi:hypothetical protein